MSASNPAETRPGWANATLYIVLGLLLYVGALGPLAALSQRHRFPTEVNHALDVIYAPLEYAANRVPAIEFALRAYVGWCTRHLRLP